MHLPAAVRRSFAAALVLTLAGVGFAAPADAHLCARPVAVEPGRPSSFTVGVPAENVPVVGVTVHIPPGFGVDRIDGADGWRTARDGAVVRFTGGRIGYLSCAAFRFHGTASERRTYAFPMTIQKSDGTTEELVSTDIGPSSAQLVFAGTDIPVFEQATSGGGFRWKALGLAGAAAGAYAFVLVRSRRRRAAAARRPAGKGRRR